MEFDSLPEYIRDVKRLKKRYRSLEEDLNVVQRILCAKPDPFSPVSFEISGLAIQTCVIKVKRIACKALKGKGSNSGLRLVYAYSPSTDKGLPSKIVFIELYFKGDKENENRGRILANFK